jgi:hypothetical protein
MMVLLRLSDDLEAPQLTSAPDWPTQIDVVVAGDRTADCTDAAADQRTGEGTAAGDGTDRRAGTGANQTAGYRPVTTVVTTASQGEPEASQNQCRRNVAGHDVNFQF